MGTFFYRTQRCSFKSAIERRGVSRHARASRRIWEVRPCSYRRSQLKVTFVAGFDPAHPAASGVQSYVTSLGKNLAGLGQEVEVPGLGSRRAVSGGIGFVSVASEGPTSF